MKNPNKEYLGLVTPWNVEEKGTVFQAGPFQIRKRHCSSVTQPHRSGEYYYLHTVNWVNVVAVTQARELVMVEQFRQGTAAVTLEFPGGLVDAGEEILKGAVRELREETGYGGENFEIIGKVAPNPAIQSNLCYTTLVENAQRKSGQDLDADEEVAVRLVPLQEIPALIQHGIISHALMIAAFFHYLNRDRLTNLAEF